MRRGIEVPQFVAEVMSTFDHCNSPFGELEVSEAIRSVAQKNSTEDQTVRDGYFAELCAFKLSTQRCGGRSIWDTYFGPTGSSTDETGNRVYSPDLKEIDADILAHWEKRAGEVMHPVLMARYADLVWDLKRAATEKKPDPAYARRAFSAYTQAVEWRLYDSPIKGIRYVERALELAVSLNDSALVGTARGAAFSLHREVRDAEKPGYCFFLFDLLLDHYRGKVDLEDAEASRILDDLEELLCTWSDRNQAYFNPPSAQDVAKRLIGHYRREDQKEHMKRVARIAGKALEEFAAMGDALLGTTVLQDVNRFYQEMGLRKDADRVLHEASRRGTDIEGCMSKVSVMFEIDKETLDKTVAELTVGSVFEAVSRIVAFFLPEADQVKTGIQQMKKEFPLLSNLRVVKTDGLTRAEIGSVDEDPDGRLVQGFTDHFAMHAPLLAIVLQELFERHGVTAEGLWEMVSESPVVSRDRIRTFQRGIERYLGGDWISAVHIMVPFLEECSRRLLQSLGGLTEKRDGTIYMATELGAVLTDPIMKTFWEEAGVPDVPLYLYVLLADQRGWNVRNRVAHGLCRDEFFSRQVADRVVHALLLFGLIRSGENAPSE